MHQLRAIQRALDLIEDQLGEPLRLESVARRVGMSLWHFQRTFTAMVGEPAGSYIRRRRLTEAARCLRVGDRTILAIALDYQFESHEAFTRAFKAEMLITPSAWRAGRGAMAPLCHPVHLTTRILHQRYRHMKLTPEIITLPARSFAGLQARFISARSPDTNNLEVIPRLWTDFDARMREIAAVEPGVCYGLSNCPDAQGEKAGRPDEVLYLAAVSVANGTRPPRDMVVWTSPAGTYAKFTHHGRVEKIGETMGFIYGPWFSRGDYDRALGPDLERMDARFRPHSDGSILEIFVPVRATKRKS